MHDFDSQAFENSASLSCQVRIDELAFDSETKLDGKIAAGMTVTVNGSQNINLTNLGHFKTKSGHYAWNEKTAKGEWMLPTKINVNASDKIVVTITLNQKKGIPLLTRDEKEIHS